MAQHDFLNVLLAPKRAAIMGIINTTPDSFSDGGQFKGQDQALKHGLDLLSQGADILDVGGESTRPGADRVSEQQELDRVIPVIQALRRETDAPISIDTYKPAVMTAAVASGANFVNDVKALSTAGALSAASSAKVPVCLMHMQGTPDSMQRAPQYQNVIDEVVDYLKSRVAECVAAGIPKQSIVVDPGIGFGKKLEHNLLLLNSIDVIEEKVGCRVLIGVSRKSMINDILGRPVEERLAASIGLATQAAINGAAIVRVHDVRATHDAIRCAEAVRNSKIN